MESLGSAWDSRYGHLLARGSLPFLAVQLQLGAGVYRYDTRGESALSTQNRKTPTNNRQDLYTSMMLGHLKTLRTVLCQGAYK